MYYYCLYFFFSLDGKETKGQGCIFFAKIVRLVAEGALSISSRKKNEAGLSGS
jgi:hypothetical protein